MINWLNYIDRFLSTNDILKRQIYYSINNTTDNDDATSTADEYD